MTKKNAPDMKVEDGNSNQPEIVKIDGDATIEATGDLTINTPMERSAPDTGAKAMMPGDELPADVAAVVEANKPKTKKVVTGKHVITGKDVVKEVAVPYEKDYSAGRKLFPVHTAVNGSYNGRRINLVAGGEVYLNEKELKVFRNYVHGEGK